MARNNKSKPADGARAEGPHTPRTRNRRAFRQYEIVERVEAGLVLQGTEVKSLRAGKCQIEEAFGRIDGGEVFLIDADIAIWPQAVGSLQHEPKRKRKCLLHKRQIEHLIKLTSGKGMTIVPLEVYFHNGYAKVQLGVGRGRQLYDKRQVVKQRQAKRDMERAIRRRR